MLYNGLDLMKAHCKCKKCGKQAEVDTSVTLTSYPAKYSYHCPECGEHGYIYCSEAYYDDRWPNTDVKILTQEEYDELLETIRELKAKVKELSSKVEKDNYGNKYKLDLDKIDSSNLYYVNKEYESATFSKFDEESVKHGSWDK